jgi:pyruvate formate lyase activating enzyme
MLISGVQRFSVLDYPEKTSCIIFTAGCNFRCGYCHNSEFVLPEKIQSIKTSFIPDEDVFSFLKQRKGLLDGVVVSGGEPTLMHDLSQFIAKIKNMGFLVKLDTNGSRPDVLDGLMHAGLLDYVAMDVKTSLGSYGDLVKKKGVSDAIAKSITLLKKCTIPYEFRATLIAQHHVKVVLKQMREQVAGARKMCLQRFRPIGTLDPSFEQLTPFSDVDMENIRQYFASVVDEVIVR